MGLTAACSSAVDVPYNALSASQSLECCMRPEPVATFVAGMMGYVPALALFSDLSGCGQFPEVGRAVTAVLDGRRLALYDDSAARVARWLLMRADPTFLGVSFS